MLERLTNLFVLVIVACVAFMAVVSTAALACHLLSRW